MYILRIILRVIIALILAFILMMCFIKVKEYNEQLNNINHYEFITEDQASIDELNQFLNHHDVDFELNYDNNLNDIKNSLPYYSSFEKFLNIVRYQSTEFDNNTQATISDLEKYYQSLNPKEQNQFDQYLNEHVSELVGGKSEK